MKSMSKSPPNFDVGLPPRKKTYLARKQIGQRTRAIGLARIAGLKLVCSYPPPKNLLGSFDLWPHITAEASYLIGGDLLRPQKYHWKQSCQDRFDL